MNFKFGIEVDYNNSLHTDNKYTNGTESEVASRDRNLGLVASRDRKLLSRDRDLCLVVGRDRDLVVSHDSDLMKKN